MKEDRGLFFYKLKEVLYIYFLKSDFCIVFVFFICLGFFRILRLWFDFYIVMYVVYYF